MNRLLDLPLSRRQALAVGGAVAAPLAVPRVFGAPERPDLVVVRGAKDKAPAEACYQRMKAGMGPLGGMAALVKGKRVLIKLNATERTSQDGNTSVPAAMALLRLVRESGPVDITVLGQEWGGFDSKRAGQPTLRQVIKEAKVKLVELPHYWQKNSQDQYQHSKVEDDVWNQLWVAKHIFEPDTVLLNLARLKTHPHCVYTGCIKNVIGLTYRMYGFHKKDDLAPPKNAGNPADSDGWDVFPRKLGVAFRDVIGPRIALNILDADQPTFGWRGPAPERIRTFAAHTTILGTDALAMDVYGCGMLHAQRPDAYVPALGDWRTGDNPYVRKNKAQANYLKLCGELGVGAADLKKVDIDELAI
jgi:uncharacterized protein (DUF362 family)